MNWVSMFSQLGAVDFPAFTGLRILMMPFHLHDLKGTLPSFAEQYAPVLERIVEKGPCRIGTAYLTVDEMALQAGQHHRRPGLHVDGWHDDGGGTWGGSWGVKGMVMVANVCGALVYKQIFWGEPKKFGDCEHLRSQCVMAYPMKPGMLFHCTGMTVHETIPVKEDCQRQFVRVSMPSKGDWNRSNTPNPLGVLPDGEIIEDRPQAFTMYQPRE